MIGDAYLTLYPSRVFFFISIVYTPEINLNLRQKTWEDLELIGTTIEKSFHWMSDQFYHRVTVRNCIFIYVKSKVFQILTYIRRERSNEQYRNTWRIFFYRIPLARRMKNRIPQGWMIPQYRTLKSKLPKYRLKKSSIPQYRKPPCPPASAWNSLLSAMKSVLKCLYIGIECPRDAFARKAVTASADRRRKFGFNVHITINTG